MCGIRECDIKIDLMTRFDLQLNVVCVEAIIISIGSVVRMYSILITFTFSRLESAYQANLYCRDSTRESGTRGTRHAPKCMTLTLIPAGRRISRHSFCFWNHAVIDILFLICALKHTWIHEYNRFSDYTNRGVREGRGREGRGKVELFHATISWFLFGQLFIYFLVYLQMFFISPVDKCWQ